MKSITFVCQTTKKGKQFEMILRRLKGKNKAYRTVVQSVTLETCSHFTRKHFPLLLDCSINPVAGINIGSFFK